MPSQETCFVHAADLHLDTPFEGLGRAAPHIADQVRDASLVAWDSLIDLTIQRRASFLVLAGDVYDGATRGIRAQLRVQRGLQKLSDQGIWTFIVHGNHDPLDGWSAIREWPERVKVFGPREVEHVTIELRDGTPATIYGMSYPQRDVTENLALRYKCAEGAGIHIAILHATLGAPGDHAPYAPCQLQDLVGRGFDYWALGHIHQRQIVNSDPWIVYPGNLQGRSPKPSETGAKGAYVVPIRAGRIAEPEFTPLDGVRFVNLDQGIENISDLPHLHEVLLQRAEELRAQHAGRALLLRARLIGRGRVHSELSRSGALEELLNALRDEMNTATPFVWWSKVVKETGMELDREVVRGRGDFASALLQHADELTQRGCEPWLETSVGPPLAARIGRRLRKVSLANPEEVLERATDIALAKIVDGDES